MQSDGDTGEVPDSDDGEAAGHDDATVADVREAFQRMFPDTGVRTSCMSFLADAIELGAKHGAARWVVSLRGPKRINLSVGRAYVVGIRDGLVSIPVNAASLDPATKTKLATLAPADEEGFRSVPGSLTYRVPANKLEAARPFLAAAHSEFIKGAAATARQTPYAYAHCPAIIEFLSAELGRQIPRPEYQGSAKDPVVLLAPNADESLQATSTSLSLPLNLILYGPPGTGKTHHLTHELIAKFRRAPTKADADAEVAEDLTWVQATAIALHELGGKAKVAALEQHPLIKAKYAATPMKAHLRSRLWSGLQSHTVESSKTVKYAARAGEQLFDKHEDSTWVLAVDLPEELLEIVKQRKTPSTVTALDDFAFVTFHQAYGYEDFIEGIRPQIEVSDDDDGGLSYSLEDGMFLKAARAALRLAGYEGSLHEFCGLTREERKARFLGVPHYAVFIDEINRGNVARIFGELITLLEDDKRLGEDNEVVVQLPYSKKRFGVPPNLHVIGTMNTADRSIEALDTALRRRFEFQELPPRPDLLDFKIDGDIEPSRMLHAINRRLEKLYDRDHCIGHAYLYALRNNPTLSGLRHVFRNKLIPLLQEYFYGDWGKIGLVLGKDFVRKREGSGKPFAEFEHDDHDALAERPSWELNDIDKLSSVAFQRIYKHASDA